MDGDHEILKNIYNILSIICYAYIASLCIRVLGWLRRRRTEIRRSQLNTFGEQMESLFLQDRTRDLMEICEERLKREPNNTAALFWEMRLYYKEQHWVTVREIINKISGIDPSAANSEILKPFIENCSFQATFLLRGANPAPRDRNDDGGVGWLTRLCRRAALTIRLCLMPRRRFFPRSPR